MGSGLVLAAALAVTAPTAGDIGLTWDEPAYRFSQLRSSQWWERLSRARSVGEVGALLDPDALLYYWTYGRHGINFHPPLAGQLNLLAHAALGRWVKDIPARRMASVAEYALASALAFGFLSRRYGAWVGGVAAGALLVMPRVYGDGHVAGTDTPGLLLWPATALAFWKGLYEPGARRWRVLVGVLVGLAFVEKMGAVLVLAPLLLWLIVSRRPRALTRADWLDGLVTSAAMLGPLGLAFAEVVRLTHKLPPPGVTDLFIDRPPGALPGAVLALPLGVWVVRRVLGRVFPRGAVWGVERPGLETWSAVLAFGPLVGWLGNPAWWRETLPRLAHYLMLNTERRGALPDIRIYYLGRIYEFSLPWDNAWVLIGVTVPAAILGASAIGLLWALGVARRDRLPLYFVVHLVTLPALRMLPTPAHDGVRLILPSFFFLAGLAGWGTVWAADALARAFRVRAKGVTRAAVAALVLGTSAWQLVKIHPYELSYYNELVGGPRGAWRSGFELTYWYDAFTPGVLDEVNRKLPPGANVVFFNDLSNPMTFLDLQSLGHLRGDIVLGALDRDRFPYVWLLSQDSKATAFTRALFVMRPWFASRPPQLGGLRVLTVADPSAVSRAWALSLLAEGEDQAPEPGRAPDWVRRNAPFLGRLWGEGLTLAPRPAVNEDLFAWAKDDPDGLRAAARALADRKPAGDDPKASRLVRMLSRFSVKRPGRGKKYRPGFAEALLRVRPEAIAEAVDIVLARPDAVRAVLTREGYTDPETIGGELD